MTFPLLPVDISVASNGPAARVSRAARVSAAPDLEMNSLQHWLQAAGPGTAVCAEWDTFWANPLKTPCLFSDHSSTRRVASPAAAAASARQRYALGRARSVISSMPKSVNQALDRSWIASATHYTQEHLASLKVSLVLSVDFCLFLPVADDESPLLERLKMPGMMGQDHLRAIVAEAYPEAREKLRGEVCLLPFVPIFDGRGGNHAELCSRARRPESLRRILGGLLGAPCKVLDPLQ